MIQYLTHCHCPQLQFQFRAFSLLQGGYVFLRVCLFVFVCLWVSSITQKVGLPWNLVEGRGVGRGGGGTFSCTVSTFYIYFANPNKNLDLVDINLISLGVGFFLVSFSYHANMINNQGKPCLPTWLLPLCKQSNLLIQYQLKPLM